MRILRTSLLVITNRAVLLLVLLLISLRCTDESARPRPVYVLPEEKFVEILVDFALAESAATINIRNVRSDMIDSVYAFDPLAQHKVSKQNYDSTIAWYARDPGAYKEVYQKVLARLSELEATKKTRRASERQDF